MALFNFSRMIADLLHIVVYVLAGGILGVGTVLVIGRMIPGMIDRLTPTIDEQKEIEYRNLSVRKVELALVRYFN